MSRQHPHTPSTLAIPGTALALVLTLTSCGGGSTSATDSTGKKLEKPSLTVAGLPLTDGAPLHIAQERGLFKKEGLDVRIQPVQQSIQALPALAKGQVDVVSSANYVTILQAAEKHTLEPRILADGATVAPHMMDVLALPDSGIKDAKDLKGKKVSVNILNNIQSLTLNSILDEQKAGRPSYRQIPFPQMGVALEKGRVDAVHASEPFATDIKEKLGARTVQDGGAPPAKGLPVSGYVSTAKFAERNPRTAAAFRRAIEKAQAIAAKDRKAVEKVLPSYAKIPPDRARAIALPDYPTATDPARLDKLGELMADQGLLKKQPDTAKLLPRPAM
ncbi:ABC transporter substrate-binding protein [Streptomyces sp. ODS28]|uniref:ABC transporter substrate-binding protein n=1 Tax=Streptomyces sp. ODS28 TaxID=3136688 RepID=UPI0031E63683